MRKMWMGLGVVLVVVALQVACFGQESAAEIAVSAAVGLAETYVEGLIRTMVVLAATAPVKAGFWDGMFSLLETFQEASLPMATWFLRPDGSYFTVDKGPASANLSDRAYFPVVMSGQIATGYFVVSRSTGKASMVTAVPVSSDGQVVGAVGVSLFLDSFSRAIAEDLALPDGFVFYAATSDGKIALHSDLDLIQADLSEAGVIAGEKATQVSELFGWTFGVGSAE